MNFQIIDLLDKLVSKDSEYDLSILMKEGVLSTEGQIVLNKLNLMTGAFASELLDNIADADINIQEVMEHLGHLMKRNEYTGCYYFLLTLFIAVDMDVPYLFIQLHSHLEVMRQYINELVDDIKDYSLDMDQ